MNAALFSMGSVSSMRILEAMKKHFDEVDQYDIRKVEMRIGKGKPLLMFEGKEIKKSYDCVYLKSSFRYALIMKSIASFFEKNSYMPIDTESFTIVNDKTFTHIALEQKGVPTPETYITPTVEAAKEVLKDINFPVILKIPGGTHGKGVMFAESIAAASGILDTLSELKQTVLLQEYIETGGEDIRAIVIGDEVVGAMTRKAVREEKRANIHAGGSAEPITLDSKTNKIAIKAAKALKSEICAVDILESVKGPLVLEANLSPGLQGIMKATNLDIPDMIGKFLAKKTREFKKEKNAEDHAEKIIEETEGKKEQQIITKLDFRGERILIPEVVAKMAGFKEDSEVIMKVKKGMIGIEKV